MVDALEMEGLVEVESLFVGLQAWSTSTAEVRFDDLRVVTSR